MRQVNWIQASLTAITLALLAPQAVASNSNIDVEEQVLQELREDERAGYTIFFREQPDLSPAYSMDWESRGHFVVETLKRTAERSQAQVRIHLDNTGADYQAFWIDNVIVVENSNRSTFDGLMQFEEIASVRADPGMSLIEPEETAEAGRGSTDIEPNISHVLAPDVWALGYEGQGMVVGGIDTGARHTHETLVNQYRGHLGGGEFDHNYNWWDGAGGSDTPVDGVFHGTHTLGTAVGDDGGSNRIGMAPQARWMACRACTNQDCPGNALLECAQFMAAPWDLNQENPDPDLRPHVVNNSWGDCGQSYNPWFQGVVDAWHAAGIVPVFSNGNNSNCGYSAPPGCNTVGNPGRYANVLGVGSTGTSDGQYAPHSNWGPTDNTWDDNPLGFPGVKPNMSAPGVLIRSATHTGDSDYGLSTGTSMSAPHVAGMVALLWQAAPCLKGDYVSTAQILMQFSDEIPYPSQCGGEGPGDVPNNATGWGEINALEIINAGLAVCGTHRIEGVVTRADTGAPLEDVQIRVVGPMPRTGVTEVDGGYELGVMPGSYEVTASKLGFFTQTVTGVEVPEEGMATVDFSLEPAPVAEVPSEGLWLEAVWSESVSETLQFANTGNADLAWSVAGEEAPQGVRSHSPELDEVFDLGAFEIDSPTNGGEPAVFTVSAGAATRGRVTGFSFSGTASNISGTASWASNTCLIVQAPDGTRYGVGGASGTQAACNVNNWAFQGIGSDSDGAYASGHDGVFDPAPNDLGEWTLTFVNDWDSTSAATIAWSDVTVTLHKTPPPMCEDAGAVSWLTADPASGTTAPGEPGATEIIADTATLSVGTFEAALCITTNDENAPLIPVPVTLTVTEAPAGELEAGDTVLAFGEVPVGNARTMSFTVTNTALPGPTMLALSNIQLVGTAFELAGGTCEAGDTMLPADGGCTVEVRFSPDSLGPAGGVVIVDTRDGQTATIELSGTGLEASDEVFTDRFED